MPADRVLGTIRECFGGTLMPPLDVFLWKTKTYDDSTGKSKSKENGK